MPTLSRSRSRFFAENYDAIDEIAVAPTMTIWGYKPTQNAGGVLVLIGDMSDREAAPDEEVGPC